MSSEVQATGPPPASPRPDRIPLLILACGGSWHPPPSGLGLVCSLQYRKPQIVLPVFSVSMQAVLVVDVHSTVTSNRLDHSLLVPMQGCAGTILSGFQSVRLPLDKKKKKKNQEKKILTFQLSNTKRYLEVHFSCSVDPSPRPSPFLTSVGYPF